jgi:LytS/YehU family sensor histidine kinase
MKKTLASLQIEVQNLENELADLYAMSEEAACFRYNVDEKQEAIVSLHEEIKDLYEKIEIAEYEEEVEVSVSWVDPAFRSLADFDRMRV